MWRKFILHLFHENQVCKNSCNIKYPWGWKSKNTINHQKNILINKKYIFNKSVDSFDKERFLKDSIHAYNIIYNAYVNKVDFLDFEYTNPKLSIALNQLRDSTDDNLIINLPKKIKVNDTILLSNKIKNEITTNNFKFLGYFNQAEISHQLTAGALGPEIKHIWDQQPIKHKLTVLYQSEDFYDIVEWERDLAEKEPEWQVSNINKII